MLWRACTNVQSRIKFAITPTLILIAYLINLWILKARNKGLYWTTNFTLSKFHTMKNGIIFFSNISHAREKLVPTRHIFRTNIFHFVKFHIAYMCIPHVDRIPPNPNVFYIRFQLFTVLSLSFLTAKYQCVISVIIWYQYVTCLESWYQFFTH